MCFFFFIVISEKILVVTELVPYGSLKNFLISKRIACVSGEASRYVNVRFGLNDRALLKIAFQIALGMQFLEKKKVREYTCNTFLLSNIIPSFHSQNVLTSLLYIFKTFSCTSALFSV